MSPPVRVRRADAADARVLAALATAAYSVYLPRMGGLAPGPMGTDYADLVATAEVWVAEVGHRIAGFLALRRAGDHVLLENVAVHPDWQGQGLGRRLLALAEERARASGVPVLRLYTHETMVENQRLYERAGYVETDRRTDDGFARVFYEKTL